MRLKTLEITNWGPHKKRTFNLDDSIVGIVGANGKGKSNLLQAIDYALTGNLNKQKQEKYIRNFGHPDGATSASVRLVFSRGGKEGEIVRTITATGSKRKLTWEDSTWTKAADVDRVMEDIMGADKASLAQAVFLKQGELARIVKGTPAERQTLFQKLMNLNFLDSRVDDLTAKIFAIRGSLQDMRPSLELAVKDRQEAADALLDLQPKEARHDSITRAVAALDRLIVLKDKVTSATTTYNTALQQAKAAETALAEALQKAGYDSREAIETAEKESAIAANEAYNHMTHVRKTLAKHKALETEKVHLNFALETYNKLYYPGIEDDVTESQTKMRVIEDMLRLAREYNAKQAVLSDLQTTLLRKVLEHKVAVQNAEHELPNLQSRAEALKKEVLDLGMQLTHIEAQLAAVAVLMKADDTAQTSADIVCPVCKQPIKRDQLLQPGETAAEAHSRIKSEKIRVENARYAATTQHDEVYLQLSACKRTIECTPDEIELLREQVATAQDDLQVIDPNGVIAQKTLEQFEVEYKEICESDGKLWKRYTDMRDAEDAARTIRDNLSEAGAVDISGMNEEEAVDAYQEASKRHSEITVQWHAISTAETHLTQTQATAQNSEAAYNQCVDDFAKAWDVLENDEEFVHNWLAIDPEETLDRDSAVDLRRAMQDMRDLRDDYTTAVAQANQLRSQIDKLDIRIKELREEVAKNENKQRLIDDLNITKSIIARTGVPLAFMQDVFEKLAGMIQETLEHMGANFTVVPDPEHACSFLFSRTDSDTGFTMAQEQLSGGQAIRLSLALLLACQQLVLPEVGLLVLDEPSSHIDGEGVEQMRDMFLAMRKILNNSDMQIVLVDHNDRLMSAFDTTITL